MRGHRRQSGEDFLWPEARYIKRFALVRSYMMTAVKLLGTLALLWATVVLLGGFVTVLKRKDFWFLTIISFMQAAGLFTLGADDNYLYLTKWRDTIYTKLIYYQLAEVTPTRHEFINMMGSAISTPVIIFVFCAPIVCLVLSVVRLRQRDFGSDNDSESNLIPALNLFYWLSLTQGAIIVLKRIFVVTARFYILAFIGHHGLSKQVIFGYKRETYFRCVKNRGSTDSWNLIIYGAGLMDSELPEDYVLGGRTLNMLLEHNIPVKWQLIHSPRHRIQKLIGSLSWRSPAERVSRWYAARIVGHIASDLKLAQFPGALECICSLLDTPGHGNSDEETLCILNERKQKRRRLAQNKLILRMKRRIPFSFMPRIFWDIDNALQNIELEEADDENLILQGLTIVENLAHDQQNCIQISNSENLLSKITGPVGADNLIEEIRMNNAAWIKVISASLRVISMLRHQFASNSKAVENLLNILDEEGDINILDLQMGAIGVLSELFLHESINMCSEKRDAFIKRMLDIFVGNKWIENYLKDRKEKILKETASKHMKDKQQPSLVKGNNQQRKEALVKKRMQEAQQRKEALVKKSMQEVHKKASQLRAKAGEALAILSKGNQINSNAIMAFNESRCVVHYLTEMLDSKINIECTINAARILNHLCAHCTANISSDKEKMLSKVLEKLFATGGGTETQAHDGLQGNSSVGNNLDIENQLSAGNDQLEHSTPPKLQQSEEMILQATLLSLYATICATWTSEKGFTEVFIEQITRNDDFQVKLLVIIEENTYATPACLAILKIVCQMVKSLMENGKGLKEMNEEIVDTLSEASETMAELESSMLFGGLDHDCHGIPVKPLFSVLVKEAREVIEKEQ